jgi:hypothetical protein
VSELAVSASARLAELEAVVERGLATFVEVGAALLEIRDTRLYRDTHTTFEDYCRERWSMRRESADRLIRSAKVVELVNPSGLIPANEAQARELVPLLADEQAVVEAWREAKAEADLIGAPLTAKVVKNAVQKRLNRVKRERVAEEVDAQKSAHWTVWDGTGWREFDTYAAVTAWRAERRAGLPDADPDEFAYLRRMAAESEAEMEAAWRSLEQLQDDYRYWRDQLSGYEASHRVGAE